MLFQVKKGKFMSKIITDANSIVAKINHNLTEFSAIYPITPSSPMGEEYCLRSENGQKNIFGTIPQVTTMQSEVGAISSSFGALYGGLYSTTFSSSQGLILMIPNLFKLSSSLKPFVLNVASRSLSSHALNIFCDHSDIYATKTTGITILCSSNVQIAQDFALLSHIVSLKSKIPVLHFFDGFITSHKTDTIEELTTEDIQKLFPFEDFYSFKKSCLISTNPKTIGTNQNPDIFFQNREAIEVYEKKLREIIPACFEEFYKTTGRKYNFFDYFGDKNATKVVVSMGSSAETLIETQKFLKKDYGVIRVNVFNPFVKEEFLKVLPKSAKIVTVLDRAKEVGSVKESLAQNIITCLVDSKISVLSGRYGLGGKDFSPACAKAVFENMDNNFFDNFTVNIIDDVNFSNLKIDEDFTILDNSVQKIVFYGLGNDGTVSASKLGLKIIGQNFDKFVCENNYYDSKKSGNLTQSQLFISTEKQEINYVETKFDFVIISNKELINKYEILSNLKENSTILINSDNGFEEFLSAQTKSNISNKNCRVFYIDATKLSNEYNLNGKINLIMLASFFELFDQKNSKLIEILKDKAKTKYKIDCSYLNEVSNKIKNFEYRTEWKTYPTCKSSNSCLPVSHFMANGEFKNQSNNITISPEKACWEENKCIRCTNCALVCPHGAISVKMTNELPNAPEDFKFIESNGKYFCLNIDTTKCTGCSACTKICPTQALFLKNYSNKNSEYFSNLTPILNDKLSKNLAYNSSYYSCQTACDGCAEIMYYNILGKMFGSHLNLINATGCSSIYNGCVGCSPFKTDSLGFGTSFISNLFEDNAEFGYGISKAKKETRNNFIEFVKKNLEKFSGNLQKNLENFLNNYENFEVCKQIYLNLKSHSFSGELEKYIELNLHQIIPMVNIIVGGDGWAYDIDFGGLEHIVSLGENVNILILDNELYANTGGQTSKATSYGAKTKYTNFKKTRKKDLFLSLFQYKNLFFSRVNLIANKNHCLKCFEKAINHNGPSIIVAYTPCLNHKIDLKDSVNHQKNAVSCGYFNLITYENGQLEFNSVPNFDLMDEFLQSEGRFSNLTKIDIEEIKQMKKEDYEFYLKLKEIL